MSWTYTSGFLANMYAIIITSASGIVLNGILFIVFIVDPLRCLRSVSSSLIINLCVADLLTAITILVWATNVWEPQRDILIAKIIFSTIWLGYTVSFLTIALLSWERYIAIRFMWTANRIVTKKRTLYAIATIWLLSSSACISIWDNYYEIYIALLSTVFELCIIIVVVFYFKLWNLRRQQRQQDSSAAVNQEMKLTVVVLLLVIILVVTTLPLMIFYQAIFFRSLTCGVECIGTVETLPIKFFPIFSLNFCLNPIVYGWRLPKYRRSFYLLCSNHCRNAFVNAFNRSYKRRRTIALSQVTTASCTSL